MIIFSGEKNTQGDAVKYLVLQKKQKVTELALKPGFAQGTSSQWLQRKAGHRGTA